MHLQLTNEYTFLHTYSKMVSKSHHYTFLSPSPPAIVRTINRSFHCPCRNVHTISGHQSLSLSYRLFVLAVQFPLQFFLNALELLLQLRLARLAAGVQPERNVPQAQKGEQENVYRVAWWDWRGKEINAV